MYYEIILLFLESLIILVLVINGNSYFGKAGVKSINNKLNIDPDGRLKISPLD